MQERKTKRKKKDDDDKVRRKDQAEGKKEDLELSSVQPLFIKAKTVHNMRAEFMGSSRRTSGRTQVDWRVCRKWDPPAIRQAVELR